MKQLFLTIKTQAKAGLTRFAFTQLDLGRPSGPPYLHSVYMSMDVCSRPAGGPFSILIQWVVKGGSRSRFTENKTVLSQFTKNKIKKIK